MGPCAIPTCAAHRVLVDARRWGALPWTHERFLPVQHTGCTWMLVGGMLSHGPMGDSYLYSTQDARGCSWMGCSFMWPWAIPTCAAHRVLVDARGWGALPWTHDRSLPEQRTGCSWMLVDGVLSHGPMCSAQDARGCSWVVCSPMYPWVIPACAARRVLVAARGGGALMDP